MGLAQVHFLCHLVNWSPGYLDMRGIVHMASIALRVSDTVSYAGWQMMHHDCQKTFADLILMLPCRDKPT